jgi:hypothetical protein
VWWQWLFSCWPCVSHRQSFYRQPPMGFLCHLNTSARKILYYPKGSGIADSFFFQRCGSWIQCGSGSELVSVRIRIWFGFSVDPDPASYVSHCGSRSGSREPNQCRSMRIRIRILVTKNFYMKNILKALIE